nr:hypothetical protein [Tanacetum cinerariifolium]
FNFWERVAIFGACFVQICKVDTHPLAVVMFLYHYWVCKPVLRTPVVSTGFQVKMSRLFLSMSQSSILPFSDRLPHIVTVCSGYSRCIATFIPFTTAGSLSGISFGDSVTILHSVSIMVFPQSVTIPPFIRNLSILWAVDETAWIFLRPGRPMMPLYGTAIKFLKALIECSSSPRDTISEIYPNG